MESSTKLLVIGSNYATDLPETQFSSKATGNRASAKELFLIQNLQNPLKMTLNSEKFGQKSECSDDSDWQDRCEQHRSATQRLARGPWTSS